MALHPALAAVRLAVRRAVADLAPGGTVLVACSGGADSLALLAATVFEGHKEALTVIGVTVDHGLQEGSAGHAEAVSEQMRSLGVDQSAVATVSVNAPGLGPEAAAREARYGVLGELAERFSADAVLLGHTLDDQAETVLLGLARGSGARSLAGMRPGFDRFRRPLLGVTRADTETACVVDGIEWWIDPHNSDERYARVRVRAKVMPMLEDELGPGVAATLARTAEQVRADSDLLDSMAQGAFDEVGSPDGLVVSKLGLLPPAIRTRVIRLAALAVGSPGSELFHQHVLAVDGLVTDYRGQKWIDLPGHVTASREGAVLQFRRADVPGPGVSPAAP